MREMIVVVLRNSLSTTTVNNDRFLNCLLLSCVLVSLFSLTCRLFRGKKEMDREDFGDGDSCLEGKCSEKEKERRVFEGEIPVSSLDFKGWCGGVPTQADHRVRE